VDFGLWGFESPLSHQQLSSPHPSRDPPGKRLRLAPVSHRVELSPVVPRGRWAAPHQNSTGPSARQIAIVILCRVARPTWGSILCSDRANRISKAVSERAQLRGELTANLWISLRPEELFTRESLSCPRFEGDLRSSRRMAVRVQPPKQGSLCGASQSSP
jgi:hypothetical protein